MPHNEIKIPTSISAQADMYIDEFFTGSIEWEKKKLKADWVNKEKATLGLVADVNKRTGDVSGKKILEIGFGSAMQVVGFAKSGGVMSGLEISERLFEIGNVNIHAHQVDADLRLYDGVNFPFESETFDLVYATSVLEHVDDFSGVIKEAHRVLKEDGVFYVSYPNRVWPKDTHTGVFFLNYINRNIAKFILERILRRNSFNNWNLHFLSYWTIKRALVKNNIDFSIKMETESPSVLKRTLKKTLANLGIHHSALLKTVMVILEKK